MKLAVGCCGQAGFSLRDYASRFAVIELQTTFYRLPQLDTAQRWRSTVLDNFSFTAKAFQGITHTLDSPTWSRAGSQRPAKNLERYGHLRPTEENFRCWSDTMAVLKVLSAKFCVVQLPPSFTMDSRSLKDVRHFFSSVDRPLPIGIEPRHVSWSLESLEFTDLLKDFDITLVTDPLKTGFVGPGEPGYLRLHGLGKKAYHYRYGDEELLQLKSIITKSPAKECYVMFNNLSMAQDASRFARLI